MMRAEISGPAAVHGALRAALAVRSDSKDLRTFVIAAGLCWSILFVVIGLRYELQMYGDGSISVGSLSLDAMDLRHQNMNQLSLDGGPVFVNGEQLVDTVASRAIDRVLNDIWQVRQRRPLAGGS